jgi:catalase-peroxidase
MKIKTTCLAALLAINSCAGNINNEEKSKNFYPNTVDLSPLRNQAISSNPYGENFNYASEFSKIDLKELKKEITQVMKTSQSWWPADYGNYGPLFIRAAWHSAGTYRTMDGRGGAGGGQQRFEPLNSWPDNVSLDKARRLLWPIKQKYGRSLSWADLMVLSGTVALESMGFETIGFAGGREDDWEADMVYWGAEKKFLESKRHTGNRNLDKPLAATRMGLIYVNPEGPNGNPDPLLAAHDIRETFGRMAMDDEETVALIAGGHTFGKAHGAHKAEECLEAEPAKTDVAKTGFGWKNNCGKGKGEDTITSGLEGAWSEAPTTWSMQYLENLFKYDWIQTKSPAGATQWIPAQESAQNIVPDAHNPKKKHAPIMFTTDLSLKFDPAYQKISKDFLNNPEKFEKAFARAWFKLTHRDMGPAARYVGAQAPKETFTWQDPITKPTYKQINENEIANLKAKILQSNLSVSQLVKTAFAAASSFRITDMRGGANGARIRLEPQKDWAVNNPQELAQTLKTLEKIQKDFNASLTGGKQVSMADVIVLAGNAAIEKAAQNAGISLKLPFAIGRGDATQAQTDVKSFAYLEPKADAFRNYYSKESYLNPVEALIDKADMLNLNVVETTALIGGLRALNANYDNSKYGILTDKKDTLSNDFFVNLLDMSIKWQKDENLEGIYNGHNRESGKLEYQATMVDLVFASNSELRAVAEVYASKDGKLKLIQDFAKVWTKLMNADRFDLKK